MGPGLVALVANYSDPLQIPEPPSTLCSVMRRWVLGSCKYGAITDVSMGGSNHKRERETERQGEEEDSLLPVCWLLRQR